MSRVLDRELDTFRRRLPELLADASNRGKYVLIHGEEVAGVYPDIDQGVAAGYEKFELAPFLVKKITEREEPKYFSRNIQCPTSLE